MNQAESQVNDYLSRPARYGNIDGTNEIGAGLLALGGSLLPFAPGNKWLYYIALLALVHFGAKLFRFRVTYRRTGFVAPKGESPKRAVFTIGAVVATVYAAGLSFGPVNPHWPLAAVLLLSVGIASAPCGPLYRKWLTSAALAAGLIAIGITPPRVLVSLFPGARSLAALLALMAYLGTVLIISGAVTLTRYLRRTVPDAETEAI